jgi:hypothetical protein
MITIFRDFAKFSVKRMAFFLKPSVMINCLHKLAVI